MSLACGAQGEGDGTDADTGTTEGPTSGVGDSTPGVGDSTSGVGDSTSGATGLTDSSGTDSGSDTEPAPGFGHSVIDNYLYIHSGAGGTAQIQLHWQPSFLNEDGSLTDVKSYRVQLGTSTGNYEIGELRLEDTELPATVIVTIDELIEGASYVVGVSTLNSADVESSVAELEGEATAPPTPCRAWDVDIASTTTISESGCYRVSEDFTGTITIAADDVELSGEGRTITHGDAGGVVLTGARSNVEVHDITFNNTSSNGHDIDLSGLSAGSGIVVRNNQLGTPAGGDADNSTIDCDGVDTGRALIYSNAATLASRSGTARNAMFVHACDNFIAWNNAITIDPDSTSTARDGGYADVDDAFLIADTFTARRCAQCTYLSNRNQSGGTKYIAHGQLAYENMHDASHRMIFFDGDDHAMVLYNTCDLSHSEGIGRCIRLRAAGAADNHIYGYNRVTAVDGNNAFYNVGGQSESPGPPFPGNSHFYFNDGGGVGDLELSSEWTGTLSTWGNTGIDDIGGAGLDAGGVWNSNDDEIVGAVQLTPSGVMSPFTAFESYTLRQVSGQTDHISFPRVWTGYDPATKTPQPPTLIRL